MSATAADVGGVRTKKPFTSTIKIRDIPPWVIRFLTFICAYALLGLSLYQGYDYAQVNTAPGSNDRIMYTIGILAFILLAHLSVYMIVLARSTGNINLSTIGWILLAWGSIISIFTSTFMYNQQTYSAIARQNQEDPIYQASMQLYKQSSSLVDSRQQLAGTLTDKVQAAPGTWQTQSRKTGGASGAQLDKAGNELAVANAALDRAEKVSTSSIEAAGSAMAGMTGISSAGWAFIRASGQTIAEMLVTFFWTLILGKRLINLVPVTSGDDEDELPKKP